MIKKGLVILVIMAFLIPTIRINAYAQDEDALRIVLKDGIYGGLIGLVVGGAALLFKDRPGDHLNIFSYGTGAGIIAGISYGLFTTIGPLTYYKDGRIHLGIPSIKAGIENREDNKKAFILSSTLFEVKF